MVDPQRYAVTETLKNGMAVAIRAARPDDRARLVAAFEKLDPESVYARFFSYKSALTEAELKRATEVDFDQRVVLLATTGSGDKEIVIGVGSYAAYPSPDGRHSAEIAFIVEEDYHGLGIASRLLKQLTVIAAKRRIERFEAEVLPENRGMLAVFERSGLQMSERNVEGVIQVTMTLPGGNPAG
jgi:RimJ/RimL family protein N-acetyltransferase